MGILIPRRFMVLILLAVIVIVPTTIVSSCGFPSFVTDPAAKTPGYRLFTGRTEGFRISFEYPDTWQRQAIYKYDTLRSIYLKSETSKTYVSSDMSYPNEPGADNASDSVQRHLRDASRREEFQLLSHTKVHLGQAEGEELVYFYRLTVPPEFAYPRGTVIDKLMVERYLAADYEGRIYSLSSSVDADKYENVKEDLEHLIATFRFLD